MLCRVCQQPVSGKRCESCGARDPKYSGLIIHDTRRTAARNFRRAGVAEKVIMEIGGWKTRSVFERYNIVDQADVREALRKLEQQRAEAAPESHDSVMIGKDSGAESQKTKPSRIN
jgi:hypothetical protein